MHKGQDQVNFVEVYQTTKPLDHLYLNRDMRFPTMWYVRPTKAQTSLRIRAV